MPGHTPCCCMAGSICDTMTHSTVMTSRIRILELGEPYFFFPTPPLPTYFIQLPHALPRRIILGQPIRRDAEAADRFARCVPFLSGPNGVEIEPGGPQLRSDILRATWRALHDAGREDEAVELLEAASWRFTETPHRAYWARQLNLIAWESKDGGARALAVAEDLARWAYEVCTEDEVPDRSLLFYNADTLGVILMMRGELEEAEELLQVAVNSPSLAEVDASATAEFRLHLGQCLQARGDHEAARIELTGALRVLEGDLATEARILLERLED